MGVQLFGKTNDGWQTERESLISKLLLKRLVWEVIIIQRKKGKKFLYAGMNPVRRATNSKLGGGMPKGHCSREGECVKAPVWIMGDRADNVLPVKGSMNGGGERVTRGQGGAKKGG